jgi:hypothetical protein
MKSVKNKHSGFEIDDNDWVVKHGCGRKQRTLYQTSDGNFFLRYADEVEVEPISELEARQLVSAWEFIDELVSAFRTGTPPNIKKYLG